MPETLQVNCDGGSRGNPGPAACSFVITKSGKTIFEQGFYLGRATNNQAEYQGVLYSLRWLTENRPALKKVVSINYSLDSLLIVNQLKGLYKIKDENLRILFHQCQDAIAHLTPIFIHFSHTRRENNSRADLLVNQALDSQLHS